MAELLPFMLLALVIGYALGSIPFGFILSRLGGAGDIRAIGSGNIGATNVLRTGRKGLAAMTLLLDAAKGFLAVWLVQHQLGPHLAALAAIGVFLGHLYPVWLGFKGGKGVATLAGIMFGLFWQGGAIFAVIWVGMLLITRISSLAGMMAAVLAPVAALYYGKTHLMTTLICCAIIILWKHRENIERLVKGEEPRIGGHKKNATVQKEQEAAQ